MAVPDLSGGNSSTFLSGKVVLDDGTALTEPAAIMTICKGQRRTETYTDSKGGFSFEFAAKPSINNGMGIEDADSASWVSPNQRSPRRTLQDCELSASIAGFTSEIVELGRIAGDQHADVGRVTLHRLAQVEGLSISATSAAAPDAARKSYEKGLKEVKKKKFEDAQKSFEKAVEIYDKYAVAWYELGRMQEERNDVTGARHSFAQSLAADAKYVNPYRSLAYLAAKEKQWVDVVDQSGKLLALNPVNFPDMWMLKAVGSYFAENLERAEKSARQGMKLDDEHHYPKLEYLLGLILEQKHAYAEAAEHLHKYVALAPTPADADQGRKELAQIEKLAPNLAAPAIAEKK